MLKKSLNFLKVFGVLIFFFGCSTEDSGGGTEKPPLNPISVHPLEAVSIELSTSISADEYQGTLGGKSVQLVKLDDTHVIFMVPSDIGEGVANLAVSSLGLDIPYDVSHVDLEGSPQEVFGQLIADAELEIQGLEEYPGAAYASDYLTEFKNSFNNATEMEQREAALLYQVNKQLIQDILTGNLEEGVYSSKSYTNTKSSNKQSSTASLSNLAKFKLYVLAAGASAATAVLAPVDPLSKGLLAAVAVVASVKALKYHDELAKTELTKLNVLINDLRSALNKQQEQRLEFTHNISKELNLRIEQRTFNASDEGDSNDNVSSFFSAHYSLNGIIQKINDVINFVNENLFMRDMGNVGNAELNESLPSVASVDASLYENFNFSVASDKVETSEIIYDNGLSVKFRIKDVENFSQDYIDTELNYSYSDNFNDFSGSFDIRVKKELNCEELDAPKITAIYKECLEDDNTVYRLIIEYDGGDFGFDSNGSYYGVDTGSNYPVRVETRNSSNDWFTMANGYSVNLIEGDRYIGKVEFLLEMAYYDGCKLTDYHNTEKKSPNNLRFSLINDCGKQSEYIERELIYYRHIDE